MNGEASGPVKIMLLDVLGRPERVVPEGQKAMQDDPEEHGGSSQGIQMVVAWGGARHAGVVIQEKGRGKKETAKE